MVTSIVSSLTASQTSRAPHEMTHGRNRARRRRTQHHPAVGGSWMVTGASTSTPNLRITHVATHEPPSVHPQSQSGTFQKSGTVIWTPIDYLFLIQQGPSFGTPQSQPRASSVSSISAACQSGRQRRASGHSAPFGPSEPRDLGIFNGNYRDPSKGIIGIL